MTFQEIMNLKGLNIKATMKSCARRESLTINQHRALALLATYRHKMHVNKNEFYNSESEKRKKYMAFLTNSLPIMLFHAGLPELNLRNEISALVTDRDAVKYSCLSLPTGSYFETVADFIAESINSRIEEYLGRIDLEYGTCYAPTHYARYSRPA